MNRQILFIGLLAVIIISGCIADLKEAGEKASNVISGEEKAVRIGTSSMEPALKEGSFAFYKEEPFESLKINDIIVFKDPGRNNMMILGRIIAIDDASLTVKQDAREDPYDMNVTKDMYVGKIVE